MTALDHHRSFGMLFLLLCSIVSGTAQAQQPGPAGPSPSVRRLTSRARDIERHGHDPSAAIDLMLVFGAWQDVPPAETTRALERLSVNRRLSAPLRAYAGTMLAHARLRNGDPEGAWRTFDELGYVRAFRVIGPFDNEGKAGFTRELPPEARRNDPVDPAAEYAGRERAVRWRPLPDIARYGYVSFDAVMRPFENVCGFAETFVRSERDRPITVWAGGGGALRVYWNGERVMEDAAYRGPDADRSVAAVVARRGWNRVLVEACVTDTLWGFYLRLAEPDGSPARDLQVDPDGAATASAPPASPPRIPPAPESTFEALSRQASERPDDPAALYDFARFLTYSDADNPAQRRALELAGRSCELEPSVDRCLFAASLAEERAEIMRFVDAAERVDAHHPRVLLTRASLAASGPGSERALRLYEAIPQDTVEGTTAMAERVSLLSSLGLRRTALALVELGAARNPGTERWARLRTGVLEALGRTDAVHAQQEAILALRHDDFDIRRALVLDALLRSDADTAMAHVDAMRRIAPDDAGAIRYAAEVLDGLGREDDAIAAYRDNVEMTPDDATAHVALGRALLRYGQRDAAAASLRTALALRPQDAATRELLEHLHPAERPDERFATPTEEILARRRQRSRWPVTVLHDLRVASVYENGLGSEFRQLVVQVHDEEGARRWRSHSIVFDPDSQWVDVRLARVYRADGTVRESTGSSVRSLTGGSYRVYYDTQALVVGFPALEPGDVVEIRYRVDDVSHRNVFADYFGDLTLLGGFDPIVKLEYVLLTPVTRALYFNDPGIADLRHEQRTEHDVRVDRFERSDVAAVRSERSMPGVTEIVPYLHVSTYRTWEDVGRWWWGLVQDQLRPDETLGRTVEELVRGAPDTRTKVERIFAWVVRNTRYVGLEFGIHGFKPYRVTQIVRRGFGDCKDKASLLYAMLRLAGVDARIALVRTRGNGDIGESPASLAVFDHAIAYVPELDLFLDGTAESSGSTELPAGDQGVTVLVVGPDGAALRRTPVLPPNRDHRERRLTVDLSSDGIRGGRGRGARRGRLGGVVSVDLPTGAHENRAAATRSRRKLPRARARRSDLRFPRRSRTPRGVSLPRARSTDGAARGHEPLGRSERALQSHARARANTVPRAHARPRVDVVVHRAPGDPGAAGPSRRARPTRRRGGVRVRSRGGAVRAHRARRDRDDGARAPAASRAGVGVRSVSTVHRAGGRAAARAHHTRGDAMSRAALTSLVVLFTAACGAAPPVHGTAPAPIERLRREAARRPRDPAAWRALAEAESYMDGGDAERLRPTIDHALELSADDPVLHFLSGNEHILRGRPAEGVTELLAAASLARTSDDPLAPAIAEVALNQAAGWSNDVPNVLPRLTEVAARILDDPGELGEPGRYAVSGMLIALARKSGERARIDEVAHRAGCLGGFRVAGPFGPEILLGYDKTYAAEGRAPLADSYDLGPGRGAQPTREARTRGCITALGSDTIREGGSYVAETFVDVAQAGPHILTLEANGSAILRIDGEPVVRMDTRRRVYPRVTFHEIPLAAGRHEIELKLTTAGSAPVVVVALARAAEHGARGAELPAGDRSFGAAIRSMLAAVRGDRVEAFESLRALSGPAPTAATLLERADALRGNPFLPPGRAADEAKHLYTLARRADPSAYFPELALSRTEPSPEERLAAMRRVVERFPAIATLWLELAALLDNRGLEDESERAELRALSTFRESCAAIQARYSTLRDRWRFDRARELLDALQGCDARSDARFSTFLAARSWDEARAELERLRPLVDEDRARALSAELATATGDEARETELLVEAETHAPRSTAPVIRQADALSTAGRRREAVALLDAAIDEDPAAMLSLSTLRRALDADDWAERYRVDGAERIGSSRRQGTPTPSTVRSSSSTTWSRGSTRTDPRRASCIRSCASRARSRSSGSARSRSPVMRSRCARSSPTDARSSPMRSRVSRAFRCPASRSGTTSSTST